MTRDEFILFQLKDQRSMWKVIFYVCIVATIASIVVGIALIVVLGEIAGAFIFAGMALFFATQVLVARSQSQTYAEALEEVGDVPVGIYMNRNYSKKTASLIARSWLSAKNYLGQVIAYALCALVMYAIPPLMIYSAVEEDTMIFAAIGAVFIAVGIWLTILAVQAGRNWKAARVFEQEDRFENNIPIVDQDSETAIQPSSEDQ